VKSEVNDVPIEADPATIQAAARDVSAARDTAETHLGDLRREVSELQPHWQGLAGTTFQNLMENYDDQSRRLVDALSAIGDLLGNQGVAIEVAEEEQQAALNKYSGPMTAV
jgi:WXG100 family type VII secretion target